MPEKIIGVSGSYGGLNLGDEAILHSMIHGLKKTDQIEIRVFSRNPKDTLSRQSVTRSIPVRELTRGEVCKEIRELDLFILGGGGILFDTEAEIFLREAQIAQDNSVPVMTFAISAGPLQSRTSQKAVMETLNNAAVVTVRDRSSKQVLEEAGVDREIIVTADPALLLDPEPLPENTQVRESLDGERCLVGISVREPGPAFPDVDQDFYHRLIADAADFIVERFDADVLFVPMERSRKDMQHSHAVISKMLRPQRASVLKGDYRSGQILTLMERFSFVLGMRLHFLIFAALKEIPFVGLPYASKVHEFISALNLVGPPLNLVNAGRLIAHLDRSWDSMESIRKSIVQAMPELKSRAEETFTIAASLLGQEVGPASRTEKKQCTG
ncbi:MAG: polysaccharide pyruvyl transferase family protein [Desulfovibrionales bacterium]